MFLTATIACILIIIRIGEQKEARDKRGPVMGLFPECNGAIQPVVELDNGFAIGLGGDNEQLEAPGLLHGDCPLPGLFALECAVMLA